MPPKLLPDELMNILDYQYLYNRDNNINFNGISFDSRQVKPGHIYVALKGQKFDGCEFAQEALQKGAVALIAEKNPAIDCPVPWITVPDSRLALAKLSAILFRHPSRELNITGVTGTCGKTTITTMLHHIYRTADLNSGLIGTVVISYGNQCKPSKMTTPDALELQKVMRQMVDNGVTHVAMEVSSHSLAQKRVEEVCFQGAIFTNITPNHLDYHLNLEKYAETKKTLASLVEPGGFILSNGDDPFLRNLKHPSKSDLFLFGEHQSCDFHINSVSLGIQESSFELTLPRKKPAGKISFQKEFLHLRIPLLGKHNVYNAAAAVAAALLNGLPEEGVINALASFRGVERRMQLHQFGNMQIIDDTAMSPGSIDAVFSTLQEISVHEPVVVYAIRGCRGTKVNEDNGRSLAYWSKVLKVRHYFTTCSNSHVDEQNMVLPEEKEAFLKESHASGVYPKHYTELPEAILQALKVVEPGKILLLLGAQGMDAGLQIAGEYIKAGKGAKACTSC